MLVMILMISGLVVIVYLAIMAQRVLRYATVTRTAILLTKPYNRLRKHSSSHILILGDSTMYSAGASNHQLTIGGLLAAKYPNASVETLAVNGAKVKNLSQQLQKAQYKKYDLVLIGIGGNDIIQLSSYASVQQELTNLLRRIEGIAEQTILCHSVNIGNIGFFLFPLTYFYDYRSRQFSELCETIAAQFSNITYVNFYRPLKNDHYDKTTRKKFIARDGFHASDYANQYFFDLLWQEIQKPKSTKKPQP